MNTRLTIKTGLALVAALLALVESPAATNPPLSLHPDNPHYFLFRGKPEVLITSAEHYGAVLNLDFDYVPYLEELHSKGLNHTRTFSGTYREVPSSFGITDNTLAPLPNRYIAPWARSSTPGYWDGGNKFDLDRWDEAYFRRLRDFAAQASKRGVVIEMNLFCPLYEEGLWKANPMNEQNNVNGVGRCPLNEVYNLAHDDLTRVQKAVTRKIVETLAKFDNVYYEICNEPWFGGVTLAWQNEIAETIRETESKLPVRHLISLNVSKQKLTNSYPNIDIFNFHYGAPPDVVAQNYGLNKALGDNETGFRGKDDFAYRTEAWDFIIAGGALVSSLDYSFTAKHPGGDFLDYTSPGGGNSTFRKQLGFLKEFIHGFDFIRMAPGDSAIKSVTPFGLVSARLLAEPGRAYAMYVRARTDMDGFVVRWTGSVTAEKDGTYTFYTSSKDTVRLWVNDQLLIEHQRRHDLAEDQGKVALQAGRPAALRLEYTQARRSSVAKLMWSGLDLPKSVIPAVRLKPPGEAGQGMRGEYFEDRTMKKQILTRLDPVIDFEWSKTDAFSGAGPTNAVIAVELPKGDYNGEWLDPKTGKVIKRERFEHAGGNREIRSPAFAEDVALKLSNRPQRRTGGGE